MCKDKFDKNKNQKEFFFLSLEKEQSRYRGGEKNELEDSADEIT